MEKFNDMSHSYPSQTDSLLDQISLDINKQSRLPTLRLEIFITILGLLGLIIFLTFYDEAFPEAAVNLKLSRAEITAKAQNYLVSNGYASDDYKFNLSFDEDYWASIYLQQTLGVAETNRLIDSENLPLYYWQTRWFKPLEKEEFNLWLAPDGEIIAFAHIQPEETPGPALAITEAQQLAETYLQQKHDHNLDLWKMVSSSEKRQPGGRVDHTFEWQKADVAFADGDLRLSVVVQGSEIGNYRIWVQVPESFQHQFRITQNLAAFYDNLSTNLGNILFGLAGLLAFLYGVWRNLFSWRQGLPVVIALSLITLLSGLNSLAIARFWYNTTQDYTLFWVNQVSGIAYAIVYYGLLIYVLWNGGRLLSKLPWPWQDKILPRVDNRLEVFSRSAWRGLMLTGMMSGYVVIFYIVATQLFGSWTPFGVNSPQTYATPLPFLRPLYIGIWAALNEELLYRLIGISVMLILFKRRWLALLVPGMLWGFAHLSYIRDPFYLRGIELTLVGVFLLGLFFLYFDLITVLIAHFAFNAMLGALPLLRADEPYFLFSGLVVIACIIAPVVPGLVSYLRRYTKHQGQKAPNLQLKYIGVEDRPALSTLDCPTEIWTESLDTPSHSKVIGLWQNNVLIGAVGGEITADNNGYIKGIYLKPTWRGRYYGARLAQAMGQYLKQAGANNLQINIPASNRKLSGFWSAQGWSPSITTYSYSLIDLPDTTPNISPNQWLKRYLKPKSWL